MDMDGPLADDTWSEVIDITEPMKWTSDNPYISKLGETAVVRIPDGSVLGEESPDASVVNLNSPESPEGTLFSRPRQTVLGLHAIKDRVISGGSKAGEMMVRPMIYLALTYDHRSSMAGRLDCSC